jgi:hypothetical protein
MPPLAVETIQRVERVDERLLRDISASARLPSMRSATENASRWYRCTSGRNASTSPSRHFEISDSSSSSRRAVLRISAISGDASSDAEIAPLSSVSAMIPELEAPD